MSTQQWPNARITLFERTCQSAWLTTETTPVGKKRVNSCVLKHPLFWGSSATQKSAETPRKCSLQRATKVTFSRIRGWRRKKKPRCAQFFETVLRTVLIDQLIWVQTFWEVVCFTAQKAKSFSFPISLFSHERKEPKCRQLAKITYRGVNSAATMQHRCSLKLGNKLGLSNHTCSTCHKLGTDCRVAPCRSLQFKISKPLCAHFHDGSGKPRK